ncbi:hypothetical protein [Nesterenkonia haasae]|uniref:hypothetical protein n=1 Tax=Nesterenkonia haasae TaxID=2587813 RepID=UPI0013911AC1|nr:hypothetical protein [Nesterenkonia haasae]NDK31656.1 hypothetical protein [Nesterenkonia haasae]
MSTSIPTFRYSAIQRAALAVSAALTSWAEASARKQQISAESRVQDSHRQLHLREAERRREDALAQRFLMPRQF